ncbi:hypothetical protein UA75_29800 [Actinoalloteichus sp. GBA129-24]|uniref:Uncharacterized protein n=1 Tax=Actinoalloteichus fjordicus TaxID=1612552 RepID=A0AAC9LI97_9PSEU|nr:hypothetical protein UA74_29270 [Actinoalloteichus fjordicus]APU23924.1 hypothetical protein UA75_29800 [Actinoalloteichus sp. GBA129-24]
MPGRRGEQDSAKRPGFGSGRLERGRLEVTDRRRCHPDGPPDRVQAGDQRIRAADPVIAATRTRSAFRPRRAFDRPPGLADLLTNPLSPTSLGRQPT